MSPSETIMAAPDGAVVLYFGLNGLADVAALDKVFELNAVGVTDEDVRGMGRAITCYPDRPMGLDGAIEVGGPEWNAVNEPTSWTPAAPDPAPAADPAPAPEAPAADAPAADVTANGDAG